MLAWIWLHELYYLGSGYLVITENKNVYKTPGQHFLATREGKQNGGNNFFHFFFTN